MKNLSFYTSNAGYTPSGVHLNKKAQHMVKRKIIIQAVSLIIVFLYSFITVTAQHARVYKAPVYEEGWNDPSIRPDRIVLNVAADPATSASVSWRTDVSVTKGYAEIAKADAAPKFWRNATTLTATTETLSAKDVETGDIHANYHSATFTDLEPNTLYGYRVGDGSHWSEWIQFKTASKEPERFSFLYVGDAQNYILELWSRLIREGFKQAPNASFIIHAGDLVNRAHNDSEWEEWFRAGGFIHSMLPSFPVPGNHEYREVRNNEPDVLALQWRPQFTLPRNGPEGLEETVYYMDYQGARIIGLNTLEDMEVQAEWLKGVLEDNPNKWTIVTYHHPLYSASAGRDNKELRALLKPIFDEYGVDLALQGHDHSYARGRVAPQEYNLVSGINKRDQTGTVYVVSVSGGKMYNVNPNAWNDFDADRDRAAENTQLIQAITVDGDVLKYQSITATGELYDAFELIKNKQGPNSFVELQHQAISGRRFANTINYEDELPVDIAQKVRKQYPDYSLSRVSASEDEGKISYYVRLQKGSDRVELNIDENGNIEVE